MQSIFLDESKILNKVSILPTNKMVKTFMRLDNQISIKHLATPLYGLVSFVIGVIISSFIIYIVTKLFGEKEGIKIAIISAVIGATVYSITYFLLGNGFWAALAGGFVWLLALKALYDIGWLKAFVIALIVWIAAAITGILLPTAPGPL